MTHAQPTNPATADAEVDREALELRARPQPVTRINRRVLIGGAAVVLIVISGLVLLALRPPSLRVSTTEELINVEHKPVTEALSALPTTYDGLPMKEKMSEAAKVAPDAPNLTHQGPIPSLEDGKSIEEERLARMAGQARESQVFFRLQAKMPVAHEGGARATSPSANTPPAAARSSDLATLSALRATDAVRALAAVDPGSLDTDNGDATRKLAFLRAEPEKDIYNPHGLQTPASPYQLMAGTIIAASLVSGLNSDLPGFVIAQVTENVFDTVSGRFLLIPQGSRLLGKYDNVVAFGQERALVIWQRLILPDGSSVVIDNLPATDTGGYAGLADEVDLHTWKLLKGVALATVLGVGSELAFGSSDNDLIKALQQSTQSTTNRAGQRLIEPNLNVQPTITIRPGWPLRVLVHKDIVLRPYPTNASH
jgi:type IV secretion system protein VirB10